jgi:hypothetical protein
MNTIQCMYPDRDAVLAAFLYDDIDPAERVAFESHLTACRLCHDELADLRGVRETLGRWAPPEPARTFTSFEPRATGLESRAANPEPPAGWWHHVPVWAQVAAAMLVLGASASIANLDVRYDHAGLSVRTGWSKPPAAATAQPEAKADAAPWRADLAALQTQLRSEMRTQPATVSAASTAPSGGAMSDADFHRRVRVLLDESERRQQNELALRLAQAERDWSAQRQADITKINQNIGYLQRDTYGELLKQREGVNYLLKVSQTR